MVKNDKVLHPFSFFKKDDLVFFGSAGFILKSFAILLRYHSSDREE